LLRHEDKAKGIPEEAEGDEATDDEIVGFFEGFGARIGFGESGDDEEVEH
jgi:hypothetical protein